MKWLKAAGAGALASVIMFIVMMVLVRGVGVAPFEVPPSAALLQALDLPPQPLAAILHFAYGILAPVILVAIAGRAGAGFAGGLILAAIMWIVMQLVFAPLIGWGAFGTAAPIEPGGGVAALESTRKYIVATLVLHLIYGLFVGLGNRMWTRKAF